MKVTIENGMLIIKAPISSPAPLSGSGKNRVLASTRGNLKTEVLHDGKPITVGLNAYVPAN